MASLSEKWRPTTWEAFIGQEKAVKRARAILGRSGFDGGAFYISGPPGTGKSSLALLIARECCDDFDIIKLDGEACTIDAVREAAKLMPYGTLSGCFRAWIVDECQAMSARAVQAWLTVLEPLAKNTIVIFTTTAESADLFGEYASPFRSRGVSSDFTNQGLAKPFAKRLKEIAVAEGLDGRDES